MHPNQHLVGSCDHCSHVGLPNKIQSAPLSPLSSIMVHPLPEDMDMMSPLTEIDELEDDEDDPTVEYKITRQLRAPRNVQYSTQSLLGTLFSLLTRSASE